MSTIQQAIQNRILVLDGAMGTMLQRHNFSEEDFRGERFKDFPHSLKGNNDLLSITQPAAIRDVHAQYFEAGADIVETNTFSSTTIGMADYHLEDLVYDLNYQSAKIAREVADEFTAKNPNKPRFVAGSIGPTNRTASMSPDVNDPGFRAVTFDDLRIAYKQQVEALIDGGCDLLLVETIFDTLNAKAALFAIEEVKEELEDLKQEKLDLINQGFKTLHDLSAKLKQLVLEKEALLRECADKVSQTEVVLYAVIRKFRIENEIAREDGLRPSYFDSLPALNPVNMPRLDNAKENALLEALEQDIKTYESNVNAQREKVYALYEQSISRLNHLKYH